MAVEYNPRVVTDGLVLALDAGNTKSYKTTIHLKGGMHNGSFFWTRDK